MTTFDGAVIPRADLVTAEADHGDDDIATDAQGLVDGG